MENEFVTYEQALALKELGFDDDCLAFYIKCEESNICIPMLRISKIEAQKIIDSANNIYNAEYTLAPLKQQVFRWFKEKYGYIFPVSHDYFNRFVGRFIWINGEYESYFTPGFKTYEEAENACIDRLIKIVKQQYK